LNALDQFSDFLGGLRRFFSQLANFVRNYGEPETVFTGARSFDGGVQRK